MKITKRTSPTHLDGWFESDSGQLFRRVVGGVAWPAKDKAGFVVILGEDLNEDQLFGIRHLRLLGEWREYLGLTFLELRPMLDCMSSLRTDMLARPFYGEIGPWMKVLSDYNRDRAKLRLPTVQVFTPPGELDFEYHAGLLRRRLLNQKTLHFGQSVITPRLGMLPANLDGLKHVDHPEIAALMYAVAGLDHTGTQSQGRGKHRPADPQGGY